MSGNSFVWYKPLGRIGQEAVDLYSCRKFIVKTYQGKIGDITEIYYFWKNKNTWIECYGLEEPDEERGSYEYLEHYFECYPEHVAHRLLAEDAYGGKLPEELEELRPYGDKEEYEKWVASRRMIDDDPTMHRPDGIPRSRPNWADKTITFNGKICKRFSRVAANQFKILDEFQQSKWARCIKNPLSGRLELKNAVDTMNAWPDSTISFAQNGVEVCWNDRTDQ